MGTELEPTSNLLLKQYAGPDGRRLQLTQFPHPTGEHMYVSVNKYQAMELALALHQWISETRREFGSMKSPESDGKYYHDEHGRHIWPD